MPRQPRLQVAGGLYHVTCRANFGRVAFRDDAERGQLICLMESTVSRFGWSCRSYCLLSTHYHLLVATPCPAIAAGMQYLNGRYAQCVNWSRRERGHLFEGRYGAVLVENEAHALEVYRYVALNPVRAGLVRKAEDWPWSSTRALLGLERPPSFLDVEAALAQFGTTMSTARRQFRRFLADGAARDAA